MTGNWLILECVVLSIVAASVTVWLLWRKGKGELDAALSQVLDMRDAEHERHHVRLVRAAEVEKALNESWYGDTKFGNSYSRYSGGAS